ncbi:aspartate--tRNA ligase [bacterium]|nr:aspartate--tRNA ligase [bacterium]
MYRTHTCSELRGSDEGKEVRLAGWVHRRRNHGGLIFMDLRDGYGYTQIVFDPENKDAYAIGDECRSEFVIEIKGLVRKRPEGQTNQNIDSGEVEVLVTGAYILNKSITPPFEIDQDKEVAEEIRLKYRYLDLRRGRMHKNIERRYKMIKFIRDFMDKKNFLEIETPIMIKGTPEGSREYIVPSRIYPGNFYVLPQSPQQMKQLLMVSSFDRYFQVARCFRDEDQRGDRQPEFTQLDVEMSFIHEEDIMNVAEELVLELSKAMIPDKKIQTTPFRRLTWQEAIDQYGSDKPDLRFEMPLVTVSEEVENCEFKVFTGALQNGGIVKSLLVKGGASFTRKDTDQMEEVAKVHKAKGLAYIKFTEEGPQSTITKFFKEEEIAKIKEKMGAETGDIIFFTADKFEVACQALGQVRLACAQKLGLADEKTLSYLWVTHFPLFEWNEEEQHISAVHHPFTRPLDEDIDLLKESPEKVRSQAYDLVLNGSEIAGGSMRIHERDLQSTIFDILGISKKDAELRFGHLLHAFEFGAPPHGGLAFGLDRLIMIFQNEPNIREIIAFPKDQKARDLMLGAPSELPANQIAEMHIDIRKPAE